MKTFFSLFLLPRTLAVMFTLGVAVVCAPVVAAKVVGTHSDGKCNVTDSAGVSASFACGSGLTQAKCNADGSCSIGALIGSVGGSDTGRIPGPKLSASPVEPD